MASKNNSRSMRFSDDILEMIESQVGETFTAKFENLVTRCMWELPRKEQELKQLQEQIDQARSDLNRIQSLRRRIEKNAYYLDSALRSAVTNIKRYEESISKATDEL